MAEEGGERDYGLTAAQRAVKGRYPAIQRKYAYLDHTADVQLHAWGDTLEEAFEQCAMAMFGYMTDTETVEPLDTVEVEAEGHDMLSLLFNFLNEWLYKFSAEEFFIPRVGRRVLFAEASPGDRSQSNHVFSHAGSGRRKTRSFCHNRYLKKGGLLDDSSASSPLSNRNHVQEEPRSQSARSSSGCRFRQQPLRR